MSRMIAAFAALMFVGASGAVGAGDASEQGRPVASPAENGTGGVFVQECLECHYCLVQPHIQTSSEGASMMRRDVGPTFECDPSFTCTGCDPEEEEDQDTELALTELIDSEGENLLRWLDEYHGEFALTVTGSTLQISRQCGQAITWLALGETELRTVTELLEQ